METNTQRKTPNTKGPLLCLFCNTLMIDNAKYKNIKKEKQAYNVFICPICRFGITQPFPKSEELNNLYSTTIYRENQARFVRPIEKLIYFFRRFRRKNIEQFHKKGRILDIGCARGLFLSMMKKSGWDTFGLELSEDTAASARRTYKLEVEASRLIDMGFKDESFDVITIWHVLEHIESNPADTINECNRILKPEGLLVIAVPNFNSFQARIFGRYWFHLDIPYHLYHFSLQNIKSLLERYSFKVVKVHHFSFEFNPFGYIQSFFNMIGIRNNLLYNILKTKSLRKNGSKLNLYISVSIMLMLSPVIIPLSFVFSFVETILGRGGTIEVYSVKHRK